MSLILFSCKLTLKNYLIVIMYGIQPRSYCVTSVQKMSNQCKVVTPVQIKTKISKFCYEDNIQSLQQSPEVFSRQSKFTHGLPRITEDNWLFSEDFQRSSSHLQRLLKGSTDHPKIFKYDQTFCRYFQKSLKMCPDKFIAI